LETLLVKVGLCLNTKGEKKAIKRENNIYIFFLDVRNCLNTKGKKKARQCRDFNKKKMSKTTLIIIREKKRPTKRPKFFFG
jgi:hypothetical protein